MQTNCEDPGTDELSSAAIEHYGGIKLQSIGSLFARPRKEQKWIVEGLLPAGGLSLLSAKPKDGKSTFAQDLAFCVARGIPFLGRFGVNPGLVIYLALEEIEDRVSEQFGVRGLAPNDPVLVQCGHEDVLSAQDLAAALSGEKPKLMIIDHLTLAFPIKDINDYVQVTQAINPLRNFVRNSDCHLMLLHHQNKSSEGRDGVLGSTALTAAVDSILTISSDANHRYLETKQRYGADLEKSVLMMNKLTREILIESRTEIKQHSIEDAMIGHLKALGEPLTQTNLMEAVAGKKETKLKALEGLKRRSDVKTLGTGRKGDPFQIQFIPGSPSHFEVPELANSGSSLKDS